MTEERIYGTISLSGLWNWFKDARIKRDINNIKQYEDIVNDYDRDCDAGDHCVTCADQDDQGVDGTCPI